MKLSVIIPVYNVESYVRTCITSVLDQSFKDFELILIDDGSTDRSRLICREFGSKDDRIVIVEQENQGVSKARNRGLALSRGEWIYFVDSDDFLADGLFESIFSQQSEKVDVIQFGFIAYSQKSEHYELYKPDRLLLVDKLLGYSENYFQVYSYYNPWIHFIRRDVIVNQSIRFSEDIKYAEDLEFVIKCHASAKKILILPLIGYNYQIREGSAMSSAHRYVNAKMHLTVAQNIINFYANRNMLADSFFYSRIAYMVKSFFSYLAKASIQPSNSEIRQDLFNFVAGNRHFVDLEKVFSRPIDKLIFKHPIFYKRLISAKIFIDKFKYLSR